jgi:hypothetical protein
MIAGAAREEAGWEVPVDCNDNKRKQLATIAGAAREEAGLDVQEGCNNN